MRKFRRWLSNSMDPEMVDEIQITRKEKRALLRGLEDAFMATEFNSTSGFKALRELQELLLRPDKKK